MSIYHDVTADEVLALTTEQFAESVNREAADAAARAACDLRTILRRGGTEADLCAETRAWIAKHDEWDARRIAEETAAGIRASVRQAALAKLTLDERRALGF